MWNLTTSEFFNFDNFCMKNCLLCRPIAMKIVKYKICLTSNWRRYTLLEFLKFWTPQFFNFNEFCMQHCLSHITIITKKFMNYPSLTSKLEALHNIKMFEVLYLQNFLILMIFVFFVAHNNCKKKVMYKICLTSKLKAPHNIKIIEVWQLQNF